jgi:hypothetical protein
LHNEDFRGAIMVGGAGDGKDVLLDIAAHSSGFKIIDSSERCSKYFDGSIFAQVFKEALINSIPTTFDE